jgi:hypothetical protein
MSSNRYQQAPYTKLALNKVLTGDIIEADACFSKRLNKKTALAAIRDEPLLHLPCSGCQ